MWIFGNSVGKNEKKSQKSQKNVSDRSIGRPVDFPFFPLVLLEYSYFDPRNYFISRHTFDREKREREE